jgi:predicted SprT family Zn-dependent metalloprotease
MYKPPIMKLNEAKDLAIQLMTKHGIVQQGWRFEFDNAKRRFGCCKYRSKRITLSVYLTELNEMSRVKNTILHEIAHALCPKEGHNEVWRAKAIQIGCDGERCYSSNEVETVKGNYSATCCGCNKVFTRFRKTNKSQSCGNCSEGRYNPTYKLNWVKN